MASRGKKRELQAATPCKSVYISARDLRVILRYGFYPSSSEAIRHAILNAMSRYREGDRDAIEFLSDNTGGKAADKITFTVAIPVAMSKEMVKISSEIGIPVSAFAVRAMKLHFDALTRAWGRP